MTGSTVSIAPRFRYPIWHLLENRDMTLMSVSPDTSSAGTVSWMTRLVLRFQLPGWAHLDFALLQHFIA